jgi:hypothetical protein
MRTTGIVMEVGAPLGAVDHADTDAGTAPMGVCVAFDDDTLEPNPTWTRLDDPGAVDLVIGWSIDRGRQGELDKTKTGSATVTLRESTTILVVEDAA